MEIQVIEIGSDSHMARPLSPYATMAILDVPEELRMKGWIGNNLSAINIGLTIIILFVYGIGGIIWLANLGSDVSHLQGDVAELKNDLKSTETKIGALESNVAVLKSDVATLKNDMATVKDDVRAILIALASQQNTSRTGDTLTQDPAQASVSTEAILHPMTDS